MCLCVAYCTFLSLVCAYFNLNKEVFTGVSSDSVHKHCYASLESDEPLADATKGSQDMTETFEQLLQFGLVVHIIGILADTGFTLRIFVKESHIFEIGAMYRAGALGLVGVYSVLWVLWALITVMTLYSH